MSDRKTIFVTGAGGFIGGRVVEVLQGLEVGTVKGGVRRWASCARIGRLPVDLVKCDIREADQVSAALEGVTHIVHCAVGDLSSTVEGTRTLLQGAADAGAKRIVHLSTVDVYGDQLGEIDESKPLMSKGQDYGDSKIAAEKVCQEFAEKGVPITILRPTLVHGPFSGSWTVEYARRLQRRPWLIAEGGCAGGLQPGLCGRSRRSGPQGVRRGDRAGRGLQRQRTRAADLASVLRCPERRDGTASARDRDTGRSQEDRGFDPPAA